MQKYRAAKYVRLSYTDDRVNESDSITNQKKLIEDFAANQPDIELVAEKVDDGYSGIIFDRPAFKEMMQEIADGKINCVIVKDLSRLGREYIETGRYLRRIFPAYGVRFIAINDHIDTAKDSSGDDLTISVKNIMNDAYCHDISVKTRSALKAKRNNGDYVGACAVYGYAKSSENRNRLAIDEYAARIVRDIFRMKLDGTSAVKIAKELNRTGVLSPSEYKKSKGLPHPTGGYADKEGAQWSATTIIRILKDEIYTGTLIQGKLGTFNYKIKDLIIKPASEWSRTENAHEAIVKNYDFELVQQILNLDTRTSPGGQQVYLFSGILICGCCGSRMTRKTIPYKENKYVYYYCPTGKKNSCHSSNMIKESDLIACALESIKSHIDNVVSLKDLLNSVHEESINHELIQQHSAQIRENERQLRQILDFKSSLYENFINGILSKEDYKHLKDKYSEDGKRLGKAIDALRRELDDVRNNTSERLKWIEHFKHFSSMTQLDRRVVVQLIHSIRICNKKEIHIAYRYQMEYDNAIKLLTMRREAV